MNLRLTTMLATTAAAAAILAGASTARADGMSGRAAGPAYEPALWSGAYVGIESGWDWDHFKGTFEPVNEKFSWNRDAMGVGLYAGYQHQFGSIVLGAEINFLGNEFDLHENPVPSSATSGNCPNTNFNCTGRVNNAITIGPRLGVAMGHFMPYVTGGWATGSVNYRSVQFGTNGSAFDAGDTRLDGYFIGGGLDWKLASNVVVGIDYKHIDLGSGTMQIICGNAACGAFGGGLGGPSPDGTVRARAESDALMIRGHLLFGAADLARSGYAPLK